MEGGACVCVCVCTSAHARMTHCQDQFWGSVILIPRKPIFLTASLLCCVFDICRARASLQSTPATPSVGIEILIHVLSPARHFSGGSQTGCELFAHLSKWKGDAEEICAGGLGGLKIDAAQCLVLPSPAGQLHLHQTGGAELTLPGTPELVLT